MFEGHYTSSKWSLSPTWPKGWKYAVDKWKKTDEDKLVQGHWTSFTHRHSMKFELYLAKWRENILGQWFYTERFLTLNFDTKKLVQGHYKPFTHKHCMGEVWALLVEEKEKYLLHGKNEIRGRQTDRQTDWSE